MPITHRFASAKADGADATLVQPGDWNDDHKYDIAVTLGAYNIITNIGTTYDNTAMSKGLGIAVVDMTGIDTIEMRVLYNKISAGSYSWQLWNHTDAAQIGVITDASALGDLKLASGSFTGIALTGLKVIRIRVLGPNATDDPVYYGGALLLRQTN